MDTNQRKNGLSITRPFGEKRSLEDGGAGRYFQPRSVF
jgi:hypothetical protein